MDLLTFVLATEKIDTVMHFAAQVCFGAAMQTQPCKRCMQTQHANATNSAPLKPHALHHPALPHRRTWTIALATASRSP